MIKEEQEFNNGKLNRKNLVYDKEHKGKLAFRYGRFFHDFKRRNGELADNFITTEESKNPYITCPCCNKAFDRKGFPYMGVFQILPKKHERRYKFIVICKECAYRISDFVIEEDGTLHKIERK